MRLEGSERIYAAGDCCNVKLESGKELRCSNLLQVSGGTLW